jgi:hypothetical protein
MNYFLTASAALPAAAFAASVAAAAALPAASLAASVAAPAALAAASLAASMAPAATPPAPAAAVAAPAIAPVAAEAAAPAAEAAASTAAVAAAATGAAAAVAAAAAGAATAGASAFLQADKATAASREAKTSDLFIVCVLNGCGAGDGSGTKRGHSYRFNATIRAIRVTHQKTRSAGFRTLDGPFLVLLACLTRNYSSDTGQSLDQPVMTGPRRHHRRAT